MTVIFFLFFFGFLVFRLEEDVDCRCFSWVVFLVLRTGFSSVRDVYFGFGFCFCGCVFVEFFKFVG